MEESRIFETSQPGPTISPKIGEAVLLRSGSHFSIYRLSIDGKHFLFKTSANKDSRSRKLLRREYELSIGCDHPHLVHVVLFGELIPGSEGILMEYIEGRTLSEFLSENPPLSTKIRIFQQLLDAVGYLHKRGIVHNDLKPDNIMISRSGDTLKLIDFGLADDDAHFLIKTPGYSPLFAAPELQNERRSDSRSDIYSIGRLMTSLFGSRYGRIRRKSTASSPDRRYQSVDALRKAFNRRKLPLHLFLAVAAAAAFCILAVFYFHERRENLEKVESVASSVEGQQEKIDRQSEASESLRNSYSELSREYNELSDSYNELNATYTNLKDSITKAKSANEKHAADVAGAVERFKTGLDRIGDKAIAGLQNCHTINEAKVKLEKLTNEAEQFRNNFPKNIDGEDISPLLSPIYTSFFDRVQKEAKKIFENINVQ